MEGRSTASKAGNILIIGEVHNEVFTPEALALMRRFAEENDNCMILFEDDSHINRFVGFFKNVGDKSRPELADELDRILDPIADDQMSETLKLHFTAVKTKLVDLANIFRKNIGFIQIGYEGMNEDLLDQKDKLWDSLQVNTRHIFKLALLGCLQHENSIYKEGRMFQDIEEVLEEGKNAITVTGEVHAIMFDESLTRVGYPVTVSYTSYDQAKTLRDCASRALKLLDDILPETSQNLPVLVHDSSLKDATQMAITHLTKEFERRVYAERDLDIALPAARILKDAGLLGPILKSLKEPEDRTSILRTSERHKLKN